MPGKRRKINGGISSSRMRKKRVTHARSFQGAEPTSLSSDTEDFSSITPRKKRATESIRPVRRKAPQTKVPTTKKVAIESVLHSDPIEKMEEPVFNNAFYTPPRRIQDKASQNKLAGILSFLVVHKKLFMFAGRILTAIVLVLWYGNATAKTTVEIRPHVSAHEINESFTLHRNPKSGELGFDVIAITDEESTAVTTTQTRAVKRKATGTITIYNEYSSEPQRLSAETRFRSASGKIYKLGDSELIIPGKRGATPGTVDAQVFAELSGPNYNSDLTDFSIPGFQESGLEDRYNGIYAVSKTKIEGGFIGEEPYLSEQERAQSEQELTKKLTDRLLVRLEKEKTDMVLLVQDSADFVFKESQLVFDESGEIGVFSRRGTVVAAVVSMDQLSEYLLENYVDLPDGVTASPGSTHRFSVVSRSSDIKNNTRFDIVADGDLLVFYDLNQEDFVSSIVSVSKKDFVDVMQENIEVDIARLKVRPFWRKKISENRDDISLEIIE